jgi:hypothetical protein
MGKARNGVVETLPYLADAEAIFTDEERCEIVDMVSMDPECGVIIAGTGGARKVRVPVGNRGKSGGARVMYYFLNDGVPIYLLSVFAKNEKQNLSKAERNDLAKLIATLKASLQRRKGQQS